MGDGCSVAVGEELDGGRAKGGRGREDLHYILTKPFPPLSLRSVSPIPVGGEGHQSSLSLSFGRRRKSRLGGISSIQPPFSSAESLFSGQLIFACLAVCFRVWL